MNNTEINALLHRWQDRIDTTLYNISLDMRAVSKERPRFTGTHVYTPPRTQKFEKLVAAAWRTYYDSPITSTIQVNVVIVDAMPKSFNDLQRLLAEAKMIFPTRGDLDNKVKAITDGLNGVAYIDDSQIVKLRASRRYGVEDMIHIEIKQMGLSPQQTEQALYSMKALNRGKTKVNRRGT